MGSLNYHVRQYASAENDSRCWKKTDSGHIAHCESPTAHYSRTEPVARQDGMDRFEIHGYEYETSPKYAVWLEILNCRHTDTALKLLSYSVQKRRATDGHVATRFVKLWMRWVNLPSWTKITLSLSRSFFCDKILDRRDGWLMSPTTAQVIHTAILFPVSHTSWTKAPQHKPTSMSVIFEQFSSKENKCVNCKQAVTSKTHAPDPQIYGPTCAIGH